MPSFRESENLLDSNISENLNLGNSYLNINEQIKTDNSGQKDVSIRSYF